jgi:DNA-binding SARP family transcriptional activator
MDNPTLPEPYLSLISSGQTDSCREILERDSLELIFNLQLPRIVLLLPLLEQVLDGAQPSPRLTLMLCSVNPELDADELSHLLNLFKQQDDPEGIAACILLALAAIWEASHDFSRLEPWVEEAGTLLASGRLPPLAQAGLLLQCSWSEVLWQADLERVNRALPEVLRLAEQAQSPSLMLMASALAVYVYGWQGDLAAAELLIQDAEPCLSSDQVSPIAVQQYQNARGLLFTFLGDAQGAEKVFTRLLEDKLLEFAPNSVWLLVHANYLHCLVSVADKMGAEGLIKVMRSRTVPDQKWYYHSYLHFNLGLAELAAGRPYKALLHAEEAAKRGRLCGSINAVRMPALLQGQALVDLDRDDEALAFFSDWIPRWEQARYYLIAAQACFEVALLYSRRNDYEAAQRYLDKANLFTPLKERVPVFYRQAGYQDQVREIVGGLRLEQQRQEFPVFIQCLGDFSILSNDKKIFPGKWKGKQSARLLKAIISMGCVDVPVEQVADALWPDTDGDKAFGAFRVALSRLRGSLQDTYPDNNLIQVKNGKVSLDLSLCALDCNTIEAGAKKALNALNGDESGIRDVMILYTGNYLPEEDEDPWHQPKRDSLRSQYTRLSLTLAGHSRAAGRKEEEIACLQEALLHDGANEELYLRLMECHLAQGSYSKALEVFDQAEASIHQAYGVCPGNALTRLARQIKDEYR